MPGHTLREGPALPADRSHDPAAGQGGRRAARGRREPAARGRGAARGLHGEDPPAPQRQEHPAAVLRAHPSRGRAEPGAGGQEAAGAEGRPEEARPAAPLDPGLRDDVAPDPSRRRRALRGPRLLRAAAARRLLFRAARRACARRAGQPAAAEPRRGVRARARGHGPGHPLAGQFVSAGADARPRGRVPAHRRDGEPAGTRLRPGVPRLLP
mmetsp:Transcript_104684/g.296261  ORF Transcript_104684/g.296261 Transcript_104684/m.296261 type:complete len:211 (-) Transcript_104684:1453-2085(-)